MFNLNPRKVFPVALLLASLTAIEGARATLVISQVYGGGGNTGAVFNRDFVELFNNGTTTISLNGKSIQYASAAGVSWQVNSLPDSTLLSGQFFLIATGSGGSNGVDLPTADFEGTINLSSTSGKLALIDGTIPIFGTTPVGTNEHISYIGYGDANAYEGIDPAPAMNNVLANQRVLAGANLGLLDTNNNSTDFEIGHPSPRNTLSPRLDILGDELPGDYNGDSLINAADYVLWRNNSGTPEGYNSWRANFGRTTGSGSSQKASVPEPATLGLLSIGLACIALSCRRFSSNAFPPSANSDPQTT